jgi:hypothetical protein
MIPPDACREVENWVHRDNEFRIRDGLTTFADDINQRPSGVISFELANGARRTVMATDVSWWAYDEATNTWTDLANGALSAGVGDQQVFRAFEQSGTTMLLGTNGADNPKKWNGSALSNNYDDIGGSPPKARCMMILADRILLGNLKTGGTVSPLAVDVSARLNFETGWQTFIALLADTSGPIVAMRELSNFVGLIYKTDAIYRAIFQVGTNPFRYEVAVTFHESEGPASTLAIITLGDGSHAYLSRGAEIKRYAGTGPLQSMGSRDLAKHIGATANIANLGRAWGTYDADNEELLFVYPEKGNSEPNIGVIIKERTGAFWPVRWPGKSMTSGGFVTIGRGLRIGDLTMPIGSITQTIGELGSAGLTRRVLLCEAGGQSYEAVGTNDAGSGIPFVLETGLNNLGNGIKNKTVKRLDHRFQTITASQEITVKIGKSKTGETRTLSNGKTINISAKGPYKTGFRETSRYFSVRLEGTANHRITWKGSFARAVERGYR